MSDSLRRGTVPFVLLAVVTALLLWSGRLTSEAAPARAPARASAQAAVPAGEAVGRVIFQTAPSTTRSVTIRSFHWNGHSGGSAFTAGDPTINLDVSSFSPSIAKALSVGTHWPSITVELYRPGTTTRFEQWKFSEVQISDLQASQSGPPSRLPREEVTWIWNRLRRDVYGTNGTTIAGTWCWDDQLKTSACP